MRLAVLDANVLYPAHVRDLLLRLAIDGRYRPVWSRRIHDEWTRNVLQDRLDITAGQLERTRRQMDRAFPDATAEGYEEHEGGINLPDPDDAHVAAAAVTAGAGLIVTFNLDDFPPEAILPLGIEAVHPDAFVFDMIEADPGGVVGAMRRHRALLRRPHVSASDYVDYLDRAGLKATAQFVRTRISEL